MICPRQFVLLHNLSFSAVAIPLGDHEIYNLVTSIYHIA